MSAVACKISDTSFILTMNFPIFDNESMCSVVEIFIKFVVNTDWNLIAGLRGAI